MSEGVVDCGVIYATDAYSAGLTVVASATAHPAEAQAFLDYLKGADASAAFEAVGFTPLAA